MMSQVIMGANKPEIHRNGQQTGNSDRNRHCSLKSKGSVEAQVSFLSDEMFWNERVVIVQFLSIQTSFKVRILGYVNYISHIYLG
jgi:hypothetical protein